MCKAVLKVFSETELPHVRDMPQSGDKYLEFQELDTDIKGTIKEYIETSPYKITKEQEKQVCNGILKYLLLNGSPFPERATETAISERLAIPRSKLRKLLGLLQWEEIIEAVPVGATQPYIVKDISKAFKQGYLSFTEVEARKLTRILGHLGNQSFHPLPTMLRAIHSSIPNDISLYQTHEWMMELVKPMIQVQRPLMAGSAVSSTTPTADDRKLVQQFIDISLGNGLSIIVREILFELDVPDEITKEQFMEGLRRVAEKYLKLIMRLTDPLIKIVETKGFTVGPIQTDKSLRKDKILAAHPNYISMFGDVLLDTPVRDPELGYIGLQTQPITPQHARITANFLRAAVRLGERAKADLDMMTEAEKRADLFEVAVERGREAVGIVERVREIPWTGSGEQALEIFAKAVEADLRDSNSWLKLGLALYDGEHYTEALEAFRLTSQFAEQAPYIFGGLVWQGHIHDILGQREKALEFYEEAKKSPGGMRHDQYGIAIDLRWVEERLRTPFQRTEGQENRSSCSTDQ